MIIELEWNKSLILEIDEFKNKIVTFNYIIDIFLNHAEKFLKKINRK